MATFRETPCESYICKGECKRGKKDAEHLGRCQTCSKYRPRAKVHHVNKKRAYLNKLKSGIDA